VTILKTRVPSFPLGDVGYLIVSIRVTIVPTGLFSWLHAERQLQVLARSISPLAKPRLWRSRGWITPLGEPSVVRNDAPCESLVSTLLEDITIPSMELFTSMTSDFDIPDSVTDVEFSRVFAKLTSMGVELAPQLSRWSMFLVFMLRSMRAVPLISEIRR